MAEIKEIYKNNFAEYLLCLALDVGEGMLRNGSEISRVEDTIERICKAYGALHVEVFTIISVIHAAIRMPDGSYSSQMRRIRSTSNNLCMLERLNALSREICSRKLPLSAFDEKIHELKRSSVYTPLLISLFSAVSSSAFAFFFGGSLKDGAVAFIIGFLIGFLDMKAPAKFNVMAKTVVSSAIGTVIAMLSCYFGISDSISFVIMGFIMLLVPGVSFGIAMRDLLWGDLIAGTLKILQAILLSLMIAFGYFIAAVFLGIFNIGLPLEDAVNQQYLSFFNRQFFISAIAALFGSLGFAVAFKTAPRHLALGAVCGMFSYITYYTVEFYTGGALFAAAFASAMFTALFAEVFSRLRRAPTTVFLVPGVIPTVPGGMLYLTMRYMLVRDWQSAFDELLGAIQIGLGIAGGILVISMIFESAAAYLKKHTKQS